MFTNTMKMSSVFGIHLGNTTASLAVCKDGRPEMLVNDAGERVTPAVVTVTDEETIVGAAAKTAMVSKWKATITCNKTLFNLDRSDYEKANNFTNTKTIVKNGEIHYCICLEEKIKYMTPQQVATCIFQKLYNTAKSALNINDNVSCVLLVSQNCTDECSQSYKTAAESAGWQVLQIINENTAAVLAYSLLDSKEPSQIVLVYRVGGTTCETVVYNLSDGMLLALDSIKSDEIGGIHFTQVLTQYLADEFFRKFKLNARENRRSMEKLKLASENCVHILSKTHTASYFIESLQDGVDFSFSITRARFELLIQPLLENFTKPIQLLLEKLSFEDSVDKVILCGGATSVPKLQAHITSLFDTSVTQILTHLNADEVLAMGAAKQAYYLIDNGIVEFLPRSMEITELITS